ncbi:hypothetical protein HOY80DRAFT_1027952 [Tuber brumale]|nr:hypothetical protein HOY80DRAFT_1027952 [Tuber brumale]
MVKDDRSDEADTPGRESPLCTTCLAPYNIDADLIARPPNTRPDPIIGTMGPWTPALTVFPTASCEREYNLPPNSSHDPASALPHLSYNPCPTATILMSPATIATTPSQQANTTPGSTLPFVMTSVATTALQASASHHPTLLLPSTSVTTTALLAPIASLHYCFVAAGSGIYNHFDRSRDSYHDLRYKHIYLMRFALLCGQRNTNTTRPPP